MKNNILKELFPRFSNETPGIAVLIEKAGKVIVKDCLGISNLETQKSITSSTAFRLASLTKPFTAMAIMILKEMGQLNFDDKLSLFFPKFPAYGKNITIRQLLTHTSGLPDHEAPLYKKINKGDEPTIYNALEVLSQEKKLLFKSGTRYTYSDSGFVILALIIEKVSCLTYSKFLNKYIFKPLQMENTVVFDETKPTIPNRAYGYRRKNNQWELYDYDPLNYIVGDEGIYSTISDLEKWNQCWVKNILVSNKTLAEALTPAKLNTGFLSRCGFSWFIDEKNGRKIIFQTGSWVGFNNIMLTNIKTNTTIIVLSNTTSFPTEKDKVNLALTILKEINC